MSQNFYYTLTYRPKKIAVSYLLPEEEVVHDCSEADDKDAFNPDDPTYGDPEDLEELEDYYKEMDKKQRLKPSKD